MKSNLLIFRHTPIDVDIKMYEYFAQEHWNGKVIVYAETSLKSERIKSGYINKSKVIETIILDKGNFQIKENFFEVNKNNYFLFYGLEFPKKYCEYLFKFKIKYGIIAEPSISLSYNNDLKNTIKRVSSVFRYLRHKKIVNNTKCFLAMGEVGVKCYKKYYGFKNKILFNFMYNDGNNPLLPRIYKNNTPIRFVYVGRINHKYKGVDLLANTLKKLEGSFICDFIGGYGDDIEDFKDQIKSNSKIRLIDPISNENLCEVLNGYDVIIIPSRGEGWNLHCNIAINAGIGVITSNHSTSHELVDSCGNGVIFDFKDKDGLTREMQKVIDNPQIINTWKSKTHQFSSKISFKTISKYYSDVLNYCFVDVNLKRPKCPWIDLKGHYHD